MEKLILTILVAMAPHASHAWLQHLAHATAQAARGDRATAAYLITLARYEAGFMERIQAGDCRGKECDGGLAHSLWQMHRRALPPGVHVEDVVGLDDDHLQAAADAAARRLRQERAMCGETPAYVFGGYAKSCRYKPPKLDARVKTFRWLMTKLR